MLLLSALAVPTLMVVVIAGAGLLPEMPRRRAREATALLAPLAVVPGLLLSLTGDTGATEIPWMLYGSVLTVDQVVARPLLLLTALLYGAALVATIWRKVVHRDRGAPALTGFLLACFVGNIGTYLAADLVTFYLFFAVMSFSAVGLVIHYRTDDARRATGVYLVMSVLSETAILGALVLTAQSGGLLIAEAPLAVADSPHTALITALTLLGFGIKAGTVPMHVWLPLAHPAAPPAASAVLSGAMVKAGLVGWLRFFPLGQTDGATSGFTMTTAGMGWLLLTLSLVGAFAAAVIGVLQRDPKVVLAYSTISQMGFVGSVVAVGLIEPALSAETTAAAVLYAAHHGLAKGALFLGVPVVTSYGRGVTGVVVLIGMVGAGLAVAGAPLTSGGLGKYVSKEAVSVIQVAGIGLDSVLPLVATGSTLLLMRFAWVMWRSERSAARSVDGELISWLLTCVAGIVVPWLVGVHWSPLELPTWDVETVWNAAWPILLGLAVGALSWFLYATGRVPDRAPRADGTTVPSGDLLVVVEALTARVVGRGGQGLRVVHGSTRATGRWVTRSGERAAGRLRQLVGVLESRLDSWEGSGTAVLVLLTGAMVLVAIGAGWLG